MPVRKHAAPHEKIKRPEDKEKNTSPPGTSGVPSKGGSRQGNIGHQANDQNDNTHR